MCRFYPQSKQQKTQQAICCDYSNMNGHSKISSTLHTIQTQPPITPHYPFCRCQHSNHLTYHKHSVQSSNSTFKLQEKTFHGGTRQFCRTTFWSTYTNNSRRPSSAYPYIIPTPFTTIHTLSRHSNTTHHQNTLTRNPDRPVIHHCDNTDISTTATNRPINKRSFPMCRTVLHK